MNSYTEQTLLEGIKAGDEKVLLFVYRTYRPIINKLIVSNSGNEADAEDIFQEGMTVVFDKLSDPFFKLTSTIKTFLYSICRNLWLQQLEKRKKMPTASIGGMEAPDDDQTAGRAITQHRQYELYREYFEKQGADCHKILQMFLSGNSLREIASVMNFSEKYAKKRKYVCQKKLMEAIRQDRRYDALLNQLA